MDRMDRQGWSEEEERERKREQEMPVASKPASWMWRTCGRKEE